MKVKIISDLSGEMSFDMTEQQAQQLIGAAAMYEKMNSKPAPAALEIPEEPKKRIQIASVIPAVKKSQNGYSGFLLIECKSCKAVRGFYAKRNETSYFCGCGARTQLDDLKPAFLTCRSCGKDFKYMTNITESRFSYNCMDCGTRIEAVINSRRNAFVTLGCH